MCVCVSVLSVHLFVSLPTFLSLFLTSLSVFVSAFSFSAHLPYLPVCHSLCLCVCICLCACLCISYAPVCESVCGAWWLIGRVESCRPDGRGFQSNSSRHVGTVGKQFTRFQRCIRAVSGAHVRPSVCRSVRSEYT